MSNFRISSEAMEAPHINSQLPRSEVLLCMQTDPDQFYPERGSVDRVEVTKVAKAVCLACGIREECLEDALNRGEEWGVWGGLTSRERRKLQKERTA